MTVRSLVSLAAATLVAALMPAPALAGPPLICHPFEIADAASLPWQGGGWHTPDPGYDVGRLTRDTLALLTPSTPTLVRMETLRRAAIYAAEDRSAARELLARLMDRARGVEASGEIDYRPWFDAGYFAATLQQLRHHDPRVARLADDVDAYGLVSKSLELSGDDPTVEFAAALVAAGEAERRHDYTRHAERARKGAPRDKLLARNIAHLY
ncbi:MAG: hypothetical protein ACRD2Z_07500 [Thermoanaerobaculia bacterium]